MSNPLLFLVFLLGNFVPGTIFAATFLEENTKNTTYESTLHHPSFNTDPCSQKPGLQITFEKQNASCKNERNGSIRATLENGKAPFSYRWSNGSRIESIENLDIGIYSLTVTDARGCTAIKNAKIFEPDQLVLRSDIRHTSCDSDNDGRMEIRTEGGVAPYTYVWEMGGGGTLRENLVAGLYSVTTTDANGCTAMVCPEIINSQPPVLATDTKAETCGGNGNDGRAYLTPQGDSPPYEVEWSTGERQKTVIANLAPGKYSVTVTNARGCSSIAEMEVNSAGGNLNVQIAADESICGDTPTGTATATVSGGIAPYTYAWSNGATGSSVNNLSAGSHGLTVTDASGCGKVVNFSIAAATSLKISVKVYNKICFGTSDGKVTLGIQGQGPYTYLWSNGSTAAEQNNLPQGPFSVTVTDVNGCSAVGTNKIPSHAELFITEQVTDVTCPNGTDGSITVIGSGGTERGYDYEWSDGQRGATINNLIAGTYTVTVKDVASLCTFTKEVTVTAPSPITIAATTTTASSEESADGSATVVVSGGTPGYTYSWSNGATTSSINNVPFGEYTLTVTDSRGCTTTTTVFIGAECTIEVSLFPTAVGCLGGDGAIVAEATKTNHSVNFIWSNGATGRSISNLTAGFYSVTATDTEGCSASTGVMVGDGCPCTDPVISNIVVVEASDMDVKDASITIELGSTGNYKYEWSDPSISGNGGTGLMAGMYSVTISDAMNSSCSIIEKINVGIVLMDPITVTTMDTPCGKSEGVANITPDNYTYTWPDGVVGPNRSDLAAGTYIVIATDPNRPDSQEMVQIIIESEGGLTIMPTINALAQCGMNNGSVTINVTGGSGNYTYNWGSSQTNSRSDLIAGTYRVTVTDANFGCEEVITFVLGNQVPNIDITIVSTGATSCIGTLDGQVNFTVSSNTGTVRIVDGLGAEYGPRDLPAGDYCLEAIDMNGCLAGSKCFTITEPDLLLVEVSRTPATCTKGGAIDVEVSGGNGSYQINWTDIGQAAGFNRQDVAAGTYAFSISDARGCSATANGLLISTVPGPSISATGNAPTTLSSTDGSASVTATGGTAPYTYQWNNGGTTATINGLGVGEYTVTVTDANGCTEITTVNLDPRCLLAISLSATKTGCLGGNGTISATATGTSEAVTYAWSNGATGSTIGNLSPGFYSVVATDATGCVASAGIMVGDGCVCSDPEIANIAIINETTVGSNDGSFTLTVVPGVGPFKYQWSDPSITGTNADGLSAGAYTVTISDATNSGCATIKTIYISNADIPTTDVTLMHTTCGNNKGSAIFTPEQLIYTWEDGLAGSRGGLAAGDYVIQVTDPSKPGSIAFIEITIESEGGLEATAIFQVLPDCGQNNGQVTITATGGSGIYSYDWGNVNTNSRNDLIAGTYEVTVTDQNFNCVEILTFTLLNNVPSIAVTINNTTPVSCTGLADGQVQFSAPTASSTRIVDGFGTIYEANALPAGNYCIEALDADGCLAGNACFEIEQPNTIYIVVNRTLATCTTGGTISVQASGGNGGFQINWNDIGPSDNPRLNVAAGVYAFTIADSKGCSAMVDRIMITQIPGPSITGIATQPTTAGSTDGSAAVSVTGGVMPYTYQWSNGGTDPTINGLGAGDYTVTVTDANGCSEITTVSLNPKCSLTISLTATPAGCDGTGGSITTAATGSNAAITYTWNNGAIGNALGNLAPGFYSVVATDAEGCVATAGIVVENGCSCTNPEIATVAVINETTAGTNDGAISLTVNPNDTYNYQWSDARIIGTSGTGLSAGVYTVTVSNAGEADCKTIKTIYVSNADIPFIDVTIIHTTCGKEEGSATFTPNHLTYTWEDGLAGSRGGLAAGDYVVTVTDPSKPGSVAFLEITILSEGGLMVTTTFDQLPDCGQNNGQVTISASGGSGNYTYDWGTINANTRSGLIAGTYEVTVTDQTFNCVEVLTFTLLNNVPNIAVTIDNISPVSCAGLADGQVQFSAPSASSTRIVDKFGNVYTANALAAGNYCIEALDADGCLAGATCFEIEQSPTLTIAVNRTLATCADGATITLQVNGGNGGYQFNWNDIGLNTDNIRTGVAAGVYALNISDSKGCSATVDGIVITQTPDPSITATATPPTTETSNDGSATVSVTSGPAPYTYAWSNGGTSESINNLGIGEYTVTVTDANGCSATTTVNLNPKCSLTISLTATPAGCDGSGGSITTAATGSNAAITYTWNNGAIGNALGNLAPGFYSVVATDTEGCVATAGIVVENGCTCTNPEIATVAVINETTVDTNDGSISLTVNPNDTYNYQWSDARIVGTSGTGLSAGAYTVTISNLGEADCKTIKTIYVSNADIPAVDVRIDHTTCGRNEGSATFTPDNLTYTWEDGLAGSRGGLAAGDYVITVTDPSKPGSVAFVEITILSEGGLTVTSSFDQLPDCGQNNGQVTINAAGGSGNYSYDWGSINASTRSDLIAGTYEVTVTDETFNCVEVLTFTLLNNVPTIAVTIDNTSPVSCAGLADGQVQFSAPTASSTRIVDKFGNVYTANALAAGNYCIEALDADGCLAGAACFEIEQPPAITIAVNRTLATCANGATINVQVSGGNGDYQFNWNDIAPSSDNIRTGVAAGIYALNLSDSKSCSATVDGIVITQTPDPSITATATPPTTETSNDGSATVSVTSGPAPYTYAWSNGGTSASINNLASGEYTVTVTDANGCSATATVNLDPRCSLTIALTATKVSCKGGDGSIAIATGGSTAIVDYTWSNGAVGATIGNLVKGYYSVTATDAEGCVATAGIRIEDGCVCDAPEIASTSVINETAVGANDGSFSLTIIPATGTYTYQWSDPNITSSSASDIGAGAYTVTITDTNNTDCQTIETIYISNLSTEIDLTITNTTCGVAEGNVSFSPATLVYTWEDGITGDRGNLAAGDYVIQATDPAISGSIRFIEVTIESEGGLDVTTSFDQLPDCGKNNGQVTITATGGSGNYSYDWGNINTPTRTGLIAGTYEVTVTDETFNCVEIHVFTLLNNVPSIAVNIDNTTPVSCAGLADGQVQFSAPNASSTRIVDGFGAEYTANALTAGNYCIEALDADGCLAGNACFEITQPMPLHVEVTRTLATCATNGAIRITTSGGNGDYQYNWSDIGLLPDNPRTDVVEGAYAFTVSDSKGCDAFVSGIIISTLDGPQLATSSTAPTTATSTDGSASVTATNGVAPYTYEWSNGATTPTLSDLPIGTYTVTVTDANACSETAEVILDPKCTIAITLTALPVGCAGNDGSITADVTGTNAALSYAWSNGATGSSISNLVPGFYSVVITDADGCTASIGAQVGENCICTPPEITNIAVINESTVGASNGSFQFNVVPAGSSYTYEWSDASISGTSASGLTSGAYTVTITDSANSACVIEETIYVNHADMPIIDLTIINTTCGRNDGSVIFTPANLTYTWPDNLTGSRGGLAAGDYVVEVSDPNRPGGIRFIEISILSEGGLTVTPNFNTLPECGLNNGSVNLTATGGSGNYSFDWGSVITNTRNDLAAGTYQVTVTDLTFNCEEILTFTLLDNVPTIDISITGTTPVSCVGAADGQVQFTATNATSTRIVDGMGAVYESNALPAGSYCIEALGADACLAGSACFDITAPSLLHIQIDRTMATCAIGGTATLTVAGGSGAYQVTWADLGSTSEILTRTDLAAGSYSFTIVDDNNCSATVDNIIIEETPGHSISLSQSNALTETSQDGSATVTATGGAAPYMYEWSNGSNTAETNNLSIGTYSVTVTDANGCIETGTVIITATCELSVAVTATNITCAGGDGQISAIANNANGVVSYQWSNGETGQTIAGLDMNFYSVTITDALGCTATSGGFIEDGCDCVRPTISTIVVIKATGLTETDGSINLTLAEGNDNFNYEWSTGHSSPAITGLTPGLYTVTISDKNNTDCSLIKNIILGNSTTPVGPVGITSTTNAECGQNNGSAELFPSGLNYAWSDGGSGNIRTDLGAGIYTVTATFSQFPGEQDIVEIVIESVGGFEATATVDQEPDCGMNNGSATISASGGSGNYGYSWGSGPTRNNLSSGTYSVTVTDLVFNCQEVVTFTINDNVPGLSVSVLNTSPVTCKGGTDGTVQFEIINSPDVPGPLSQRITDGKGNTFTASALPAGDYCLEVRDGNNCLAGSACFIITEPDLLYIEVSRTPAICSRMGTVIVKASGGNDDYSFNWTDIPGNDDTPTRSDLAPGVYALEAMDGKGCSVFVESIIIGEPRTPTVSLESTQPATLSSNDGSVTAIVTGGSAPYRYLWSNGGPRDSATISDLGPGIYSVTVVDANGCFEELDITLEAICTFDLQSASINNTSCAGNDGNLEIVFIGGTGTISYNWSTGATGPGIANLSPGPYSVTVTDEATCEYIEEFFIKNDCGCTTPIIESIVTINETIPGLKDGSVKIEVDNGIATTYQWSDPSISGNEASGLMAGVYTVTISDDGKEACAVVETIIINNPSPVEIISQTGTLCGQATGSVLLGPDSLNYAWSDGGTGNSRDNLAAGAYIVTVTTNGQMGVAFVEVIIETEGGLIATPTVLNQPDCGSSNGSIQIVTSGGSGNYEYSWGDSNTRNNLGSGTYTVTVTDIDFGCTEILTFTLLDNVPSVEVAAVVTPVSCVGGSDGSVQIDITPNPNAAGPFTTIITDGLGNEFEANNLPAGQYCAEVYDTNNCLSGNSCFEIVEPEKIKVQVTKTLASCMDDGGIQLDIQGGNGGYMVNWGDLAGTNNDINRSGLGVGTYDFEVVDAKGCTATGTVMLGKVPDPQLTIEATNTSNLTSVDGAATASTSGGTAPYTYEWSNGSTETGIEGLAPGTYMVTVTDAKGCSTTTTVEISPDCTISVVEVRVDELAECNANDGAAQIIVTNASEDLTYSWGAGDTQTNLAAGAYEVTVTDNLNGCTTVAAFSIDNKPTTASININPLEVCLNENGTLDFNVARSACFEGPMEIEIRDANGNVFEVDNLPVGDFTISVKDANGVVISSEDFTVSNTPNIGIAQNIQPASCDALGAIELEVVGGNDNYTFDWEDVTGANNGPNRDDLAPGSYELLLTNQQTGCVSTSSYTIPGEGLDLSTVQEVFTCDGDAVQLSVLNNKDTDQLTYTWTPAAPILEGANTGTPTVAVNDMEVFTYTVENQFGCEQSGTVTVVSASTRPPGTITQSLNCNGTSVDFRSEGGASDYYIWDFGDGNTSTEPNPTHEYASPGQYDVTLQLDPRFPCAEAFGILSSRRVNILEDVVTETSFTTNYDPCTDEGVVNFINTSNISPSPVNWEWDFGNGMTSTEENPQIQLENSENLTVTLTATTDTGCEDEVSLQQMVEVLRIPTVVDSIAACANIPTSLNPNAIQDDTKYSWNPSDLLDNSNIANPTATVGKTTLFEVVISQEMCETKSSVLVVIPEPAEYELTEDMPVCSVEEILIVADTEAEGMIVWSNLPTFTDTISTAPEFMAPPGEYFFQFTDEFGCRYEDAVLIEDARINGEIMSDNGNPLCLGDGSTLSVRNNMPDFEYISYEWSGDNGILSEDLNSPRLDIQPTVTTEYSVILMNIAGCEDTLYQSIEVTDLVTDVNLTASEDTIFISETVELDITPNTGLNVTWNDDPSAGPTRTVSPMDNTTYTATITDDNGCTTTKQVTIFVLNPTCGPPNIFIPNAFSPNDDGRNDVFRVRGTGISEVYLVVVNRWGEEVFVGNSQGEVWDGRFNGQLVDPDVYGYYARLTCFNGEVYEQQGNVTVLR